MAANRERYGLIKPALDAHTMGINAAAELLVDCGYEVLLADDAVAAALEDYRHEVQRKIVVDWLKENEITRVGVSYRLDQEDAVNTVGYLVEEIRRNRMFTSQGGNIERIFFGGLPGACADINKEFGEVVETFMGGESVRESLTKLGVPLERIPKDMIEGSAYDDGRMAFGKEIIDSQEYKSYMPKEDLRYPEYGTKSDSVVKRIEANLNQANRPLIRAHVGPYSSSASREENVQEFLSWAKALAGIGHLDILSIGSSQLTQSNFGEDWGDRTNGGGVPVNSPQEYRMIWEAARPLLTRTYAGTKNVRQLAQMHEETLNISWHALSLWWFNKLDERGPYDLYTNLEEHIAAMRYIAKTDKPLEPNVPHHFAFRGGDDVTYIVSAYLAAKLSKSMGIKTHIQQNMLNTPQSTWGIQDLAKSRAMLKLLKDLEDENFKIVLQTRAGLSYFKPDLYEAKVQLAAVTALMDDIDPHNEASPQIIHVVSYSEASHLATPDVVDESIQITQHSLQKYRELRRTGAIEDMSKHQEVAVRMNELYQSARAVIKAIESSIENPYSAEGFYKIFAAGFMPVPYLWGEVDEFRHAKDWKTKPVKGGVKLVDANGLPLSTEERVDRAIGNLDDARYNLKQRLSLQSGLLSG